MYLIVYSQDCDDVDDDEEFGPKGVRRDFHSADQSRGRGQMDPAHGVIQRDLNKLKSAVNIPQVQTNEMTNTKTNNHVDPTKQKKKAALLRALDDLMLDSSEDEA